MRGCHDRGGDVPPPGVAAQQMGCERSSAAAAAESGAPLASAACCCVRSARNSARSSAAAAAARCATGGGRGLGAHQSACIAHAVDEGEGWPRNCACAPHAPGSGGWLASVGGAPYRRPRWPRGCASLSRRIGAAACATVSPEGARATAPTAGGATDAAVARDEREPNEAERTLQTWPRDSRGIGGATGAWPPRLLERGVDDARGDGRRAATPGEPAPLAVALGSRAPRLPSWRIEGTSFEGSAWKDEGAGAAGWRGVRGVRAAAVAPSLPAGAEAGGTRRGGAALGACATCALRWLLMARGAGPSAAGDVPRPAADGPRPGGGGPRPGGGAPRPAADAPRPGGGTPRPGVDAALGCARLGGTAGCGAEAILPALGVLSRCALAFALRAVSRADARPDQRRNLSMCFVSCIIANMEATSCSS